MIHLEILELNFFGLNKYTKRNIELRGMKDILFEGRDSTVDKGVIDINESYSVMRKENNNKIVEMNENYNDK